MNRQTGSMLLEMMIGLTVLTVGLLGFFTSFTANFSAASDVRDQDEARVAMENVAETLRSADFTTVYQSYSGTTFEAPYLTLSTSTSSGGSTQTASSSTSTSACVQPSFYINETTLPAEFGPVLDIDGSGGLQSTNCSTTYKILPVRLTLTYTSGGRTVTKDDYLLLSQ